MFMGTHRDRHWKQLNRNDLCIRNGYSILLGCLGSSDKASAAMQETWVQSLGQEDLLEKGMATYSSTPDWRIPWTEEPSRLQSIGSQRVGHDWVTEHTQYVIMPNWEKIHTHMLDYPKSQYRSRSSLSGSKLMHCRLHCLLLLIA